MLRINLMSNFQFNYLNSLENVTDEFETAFKKSLISFIHTHFTNIMLLYYTSQSRNVPNKTHLKDQGN